MGSSPVARRRQAQELLRRHAPRGEGETGQGRARAAAGHPPGQREADRGAVLDRWLVDVVQATTRPKTQRNYTQYVRNHLAPELGRIPLARLGPDDVQAMLNRKLAAGLSPRTVHH